jgi:hypothetical protein
MPASDNPHANDNTNPHIQSNEYSPTYCHTDLITDCNVKTDRNSRSFADTSDCV